MRLIEVADVCEILADMYPTDGETVISYKEIDKAYTKVQRLPTVDAVPVKHGRWIHCKGESSIWYCSECGEKIIYNPLRKTYRPDKKPVSEINKWCRNCGAKMDLEEKDAKEET